ncbi:MAG: DUF2029 domain-containing protein [Chloroflexi bacterium]|nr:DUF2029 domain-containing protein [Chloroflexota bacterium]
MVSNKALIKIPLISVLTIAAGLLTANIWPQGVDFYYSFYPYVHEWVHGNLEMYKPGNEIIIYNTPWLVFMMTPLALLSFKLAQSFLYVTTIVAIFTSIDLLKIYKRIPIHVLLMACVNLILVDLFLRGQIDAVILLGVVLGAWGIERKQPYILSLGFCFLSMKPLNVALVGLVYLVAIRHWPHRDQLKVISIPVGLVALACVLIGPDWPIRYLAYPSKQKPIDDIATTLWKGLDLLGLPHAPFMVLGMVAAIAVIGLAFKLGATEWTISLALTSNFVFTNYAQAYHYIVLIPAFVFVARENWKWGVVAYLLTWTPIARLYWGYDASALDVLYPIVLLLGAWRVGFQLHQPRLARYTTTSVLSDRKISDDA